jgi:hypothetical protein
VHCGNTKCGFVLRAAPFCISVAIFFNPDVFSAQTGSMNIAAQEQMPVTRFIHVNCQEPWLTRLAQ